MAVKDKALLLGLLLIGLTVLGENDARTMNVRLSTIGPSPDRLLVVGNGRETSTKIVEQRDGLMIIDDSLSGRSGRDMVARIQALSSKPVRYLIYRHDDGDREPQDRAFRQAWPDIVIVSTQEQPAGISVIPLAKSVLGLAEDYAHVRSALGHLKVRETSVLDDAVDTIESLRKLLDRLAKARLTIGFATPGKPPCRNA